MGLGQRRDPRDTRIPPKSDQEAIPSIHQLRGSGQGYGRSRAHEGGHFWDVFNPGNVCTGLEGAPGLVPQAEPFQLKTPHQII